MFEGPDIFLEISLKTYINKKVPQLAGLFCFILAGSNLPSSNQITNKNPEELKEAQIQRFLADLRAISHFCKVFRVGQK
jgi:hypothetical protein